MTELPTGWAMRSLSDVCLPVIKADPISTGHNQVRYVDIGLVDGEQHRLPEIPLIDSVSAPSRCRQMISAGDTVFSTVRPYLEKIAYIDSSLDGEFASTGFCVLRPGPTIMPRYLFYYSLSRQMLDQVFAHQRGVSYPAVLEKNVKAVTIPLPPIDEQRLIVDILEDHLSRIDAGVRGLGETVERIRLLRVSSLVRNVRSDEESQTGSLMFGNESLALAPGWAAGCVAQAAELVQYGTSSKAHAGQLPGDVAVLRMGNVKDGRLEWGSLKYIAANHPGLEKLILHPGDLLFNRTNSAEHVGKSAVFDGVRDPATFASYLIRVRFRPEVDPRWANMVINSRYGRAYVTSVTSQQVGQANVNGTKLKAFPLPIPPLDEQTRRIQRHEETVDRADRLLAEVQTATQRLQSLRRSLLVAAFSGQLTGRASDREMVEEMTGSEARGVAGQRSARGRCGGDAAPAAVARL
jgi:type I restriction enzyme S subunit